MGEVVLVWGMGKRRRKKRRRRVGSGYGGDLVDPNKISRAHLRSKADTYNPPPFDRVRRTYVRIFKMGWDFNYVVLLHM